MSAEPSSVILLPASINGWWNLAYRGPLIRFPQSLYPNGEAVGFGSSPSVDEVW
jgi:hypothetical protein